MADAAEGDGRRARWAQHTQDRRERIIDAAIDATEDVAPGESVHLQEIATRAGLNRTVIYRYFNERADLDRAVRHAILDRLGAELEPSLHLNGSITEIINGIVGSYIRWAAAHPSLHRVVERDLGGTGYGGEATGGKDMGRRIEWLILLGAEALGVPLNDEDKASIDSLAFGIVGAVVGSTRRWVGRGDQLPEVEVFAARVSETVQYILMGHAQRLGIHLDHDVDLSALFAPARPER